MARDGELISGQDGNGIYLRDGAERGKPRRGGDLFSAPLDEKGEYFISKVSIARRRDRTIAVTLEAPKYWEGITVEGKPVQYPIGDDIPAKVETALNEEFNGTITREKPDKDFERYALSVADRANLRKAGRDIVFTLDGNMTIKGALARLEAAQLISPEMASLARKSIPKAIEEEEKREVSGGITGAGRW